MKLRVMVKGEGDCEVQCKGEFHTQDGGDGEG